MLFDLENLNPGTRFYFDDKDREKGWICVRQLSGDKAMEIEKAVTTRRFEYKRGQRYEVVEKDRDKERELTIDYTLPEWLLYDKDKNKIPCTVENKLKMVQNSPKFQLKYVESLAAVLDADIEQKEEEEKN